MSVKTGKEALLLWAQVRINGYPGVKVNNFTDSWGDGLAFCALIHSYEGDRLIQFNTLSPSNKRENLQLAFQVANELGVPDLLDADYLLIPGGLDRRSIMTYLSELYHYFKKAYPEVPDSPYPYSKSQGISFNLQELSSEQLTQLLMKEREKKGLKAKTPNGANLPKRDPAELAKKAEEDKARQEKRKQIEEEARERRRREEEEERLKREEIQKFRQLNNPGSQPIGASDGGSGGLKNRIKEIEEADRKQKEIEEERRRAAFDRTKRGSVDLSKFQGGSGGGIVTADENPVSVRQKELEEINRMRKERAFGSNNAATTAVNGGEDSKVPNRQQELAEIDRVRKQNRASVNYGNAINGNSGGEDESSSNKPPLNPTRQKELEEIDRLRKERKEQDNTSSTSSDSTTNTPSRQKELEEIDRIRKQNRASVNLSETSVKEEEKVVEQQNQVVPSTIVEEKEEEKITTPVAVVESPRVESPREESPSSSTSPRSTTQDEPILDERERKKLEREKRIKEMQEKEEQDRIEREKAREQRRLEREQREK